MCHDFGKASTYFQDYLAGKYTGELKQHGEISAYFTYYMLPEQWKIIGFICVKKHHGNIDIEDNSFFSSSDNEKLIRISKSIKRNINELSHIYNIELDEFFNKLENGELIKEVRLSYIKRNKLMKKKSMLDNEEEFIWLQYLWSLLLTADKTQLIKGSTFKNKAIFSEKITNKYKELLRDNMIKINPKIKESLLFNIREYIYCSVMKSIDDINIDNDKILSINVPTGTGKTIAVYGAAFKLSERIRKEKAIIPNIIYNIPFMSVIDQNYDVLEDILKASNINISSDLVLKHHSMSPIEYMDSEEIEYRNYDARFLVENWQSTIITTTFVQFFNSIFKSGINSIMHRFHKLAGSIIILDEVQAIPTKYYPIIEDVFKILSNKFNCYVITVTATKPLFLQGKELVKHNTKIFEMMNRIVFENHINESIYLDEFKDIVLDDIKNHKEKSFLIILNTVKSTLSVFDYLKKQIGEERKIVYLSTEIIPVLRLEMIKEIKNHKEKYILVSTQLIEAGVDLDFDVVYRDIAPMDCINQSAGRANRNGINGKGIVKIYKLIDERDKLYASYVYSMPLIEATLNMLKDKVKIEESELGNINELYFKKVKEVTGKRGEEEHNIFYDYMKGFKMQEIRKFELIDENRNKMDVIIRYDQEAEKCIDIIENCEEFEEQEIVNAWRILNKYRISVKKDDVINNMVHEIKGCSFLNGTDYDKNRGIIRRTILTI